MTLKHHLARSTASAPARLLAHQHGRLGYQQHPCRASQPRHQQHLPPRSPPQPRRQQQLHPRSASHPRRCLSVCWRLAKSAFRTGEVAIILDSIKRAAHNTRQARKICENAATSFSTRGHCLGGSTSASEHAAGAAAAEPAIQVRPGHYATCTLRDMLSPAFPGTWGAHQRLIVALNRWHVAQGGIHEQKKDCRFRDSNLSTCVIFQ